MLSAIKASKWKKMGLGIEMTNSPPKKNLEIWTSVLHAFLFHLEEKKKALIQKKCSISIFHLCKLHSE